MYINLPLRARPDRRIHKTYEFLEHFYVEVYPTRRNLWAAVVVVLTLTNLWLIFFK